MFDRRYLIEIHYTDWTTPKEKKATEVYRIEGDSADYSLNVEFSCSVNPAGVSSNGRVTIYGLSKEVINRLSAIRRYEYAKNAQNRNYLTLAVGYTDYENGKPMKSPWYRVIGGTIIEAIPGPNPDRSLAFTIQTCHLRYYNSENTEWLGDKTNDWEVNNKTGEAKEKAKPIPLGDWLEKCIDFYNVKSEEGVTDFRVINFQVERENPEEFEQLKSLIMSDTQFPLSKEEFVSFCQGQGIDTNVIEPDQTKSSDNETGLMNNLTQIKISVHKADFNVENTVDIGTVSVEASAIKDDGTIDKCEIEYVDQAHGMIGIPTSIPEGARVSLILKKPILPGRYVYLTSKMFEKLNSKNFFHCGNGVYRVLETTFQGTFRGDQWMQTLRLNRGTNLL